MSDSILTGTKKMLGLAEDYTVFDHDIITHINSVLMIVSQIGVGPEEGMMIEDASTTWDDLLGGDNMLNTVKSYVYLRVRMLFDPPTTGFLVTAMDDQVKELEWRLNTYRESIYWTAPSKEVLL